MITTTSTVTSVTPAAGSNVSVTFPYRFDEEEHLLVYRVSSAGVRTTLTEGTHYSVSGAGDSGGGTIILNTVNTGDTIIIQREVDITQQQDYVANAKFPADSHEGQMDKQIMIDQQLNDALNRAIRVLPGEDAPAVSAKGSRKNKAILWDANGNYAEYSPAQFWSWLPIPPGTGVNQGTAMWADDAARSVKVPDFANQIGFQVDDRSLWHSTGTTAGSWRFIHRLDATPVRTAQELRDAVDAGDEKILIVGDVLIDQDFSGLNAIPQDIAISFLPGSALDFNNDTTYKIEINGPLFAHPHHVIFKNYAYDSAAFATDYPTWGTGKNLSESVHGSFGGVDRHLGWWTQPYPFSTDHTDALRAAINSFQIWAGNVRNVSIPADWRRDDSTTVSSTYTGTLWLTHGGLRTTKQIVVQSRPIRIEGVGHGGTVIRREDRDAGSLFTANTIDNRLEFTAAHGFSDGDPVVIAFAGSNNDSYSMPGGLAKSKRFYVRDSVDSNPYHFKVAKHPGGPAVTITSAGTGSFLAHKTEQSVKTFTDTDVSNVGGKITFSIANDFIEGQPLRFYRPSDESLPTGVSPNWHYFATNVTSTTFQVASAQKGAAIAYTDSGTSGGSFRVEPECSVFCCVGTLPGFVFCRAGVSVGACCSPNTAIFDFSGSSFFEHSKVEENLFLIEYGGNMLRSTGGAGLNHMRWDRNTNFYDIPDAGEVLTGSVDSGNDALDTIRITTALGGVSWEEFCEENIGNVPEIYFAGVAGTPTYGISTMESTGDTLKLIEKKGNGSWQALSVNPQPSALVGEVFSLSFPDQRTGVLGLTKQQRTHFLLDGLDAKISLSHNTSTRGNYGILITGARGSAVNCLNNHWESQEVVFEVYPETQISTGGRAQVLNIMGDQYSNFTNNGTMLRITSGKAVVNALGITHYNASLNDYHVIQQVDDMEHNGQTGTLTSGDGTLTGEGLVDGRESDRVISTVQRGRLGFSVQSSQAKSTTIASDSAADVATALGLDLFWRADNEAFKSTGPDVSAGDGEDVVLWRDIVGNLEFVSLASPSDPNYDSAVTELNGKPALYFDGASAEGLRKTSTGTGLFPNADRGGFFFVAYMDTDASVDQYVFRTNTAGNIPHIGAFWWDSSEKMRVFYRKNTGSTPAEDWAVSSEVISGSAPIGAWASVAAYNSNFARGYHTNSRIHYGVALTPAVTTTAFIGITDLATAPWHGWIADFGVWYDTPNYATIRKTIGYIRERYQIKMVDRLQD